MRINQQIKALMLSIKSHTFRQRQLTTRLQEIRAKIDAHLHSVNKVQNYLNEYKQQMLCKTHNINLLCNFDKFILKMTGLIDSEQETVMQLKQEYSSYHTQYLQQKLKLDALQKKLTQLEALKRINAAETADLLLQEQLPHVRTISR